MNAKGIRNIKSNKLLTESLLYESLLCPFPHQELPHFKELIFEDFSRFLLVENMFEEVVLHSVTKDIMMGEGQETLRCRTDCGHGVSSGS